MGKRNRVQRNPGKAKAASYLRALDELIETERRRLNHAEGILMCLAVALDQGGSRAILYSDVVNAANNLIIEAVNRLDSVNRARVLAGAATDLDDE